MTLVKSANCLQETPISFSVESQDPPVSICMEKEAAGSGNVLGLQADWVPKVLRTQVQFSVLVHLSQRSMRVPTLILGRGFTR